MRNKFFHALRLFLALLIVLGADMSRFPRVAAVESVRLENTEI